MGSGATPQPDAVWRGFELAVERCTLNGIAVSREELSDVENRFRDYVISRMPVTPDRAVELLAEHVGIATAARIRYEEPPLEDRDIEEYATAASAFFNSFWHDPPY